LKVLYDLNAAGFQAFLVGGGVRDLLLGLSPKDFDIATDAEPEQVRQIFQNSRIIGRRFRIVHVHFGREIIEVSTFRAQAAQSTEIKGISSNRRVSHLDSAHSQAGMILRDNVFGSIEEDALRRDFTANALYYTVRNFEVHDFTNGMADIQQRILRIIGDPEQRYREDPVRILRAVRLASKLNFSIEKATAEAIRPNVHLLQSVPPARLFDEFMKLFFNASGMATYRQLLSYSVISILFPAIAEFLSEKQDLLMLEGAFLSTDNRISEGKSVTPAFLLAAILWPAVRRQYQLYLDSEIPPLPAMHRASEDIIRAQLELIAIPKRFSIPMREIWEYQLRLEHRSGRRAFSLLDHKRFRAAYDFLLIREASGEQLEGLGAWWTDFQAADAQGRKAMQDHLQKNRISKSRKRRVKSKRTAKRISQ
jgi:poly(A) polymerase